MKKILIFYASYGGGHLNAAKSIKEYFDNNYKNCEIELIDCMIRILDTLAEQQINIDYLMKLKMDYNENRPYRHGGKKA